MIETEWSKPEKVIARKMAAGIDEASDIWQLHDYLTEKLKEMAIKYNYRYSVLISVFGLLMSEGWIKQEDLAGLSDEKLQEIRRTADFFMRI